MPAITLTITTAGRAALVNAATAGTNEVRIAAAGLTTTAFVASDAAVALPGEFARVAGVAGATVDPDTISLVIRDDSAAAYTLRGFGLFLDDGTLFALYGQAGAILEKTANSTALIAVDVRFADIDAATLTFGNANFLNPPATTTVQGVIEIATNVEAVAGTDDVRAVTPLGVKSVIDARFGANAASAFVRTLLTAATAAAFRLVLGLKSAALKDEGHGNGLDADTLDGHHLRVGANAAVWPGVAFVDAAGTLEVGRTIDFHAVTADAADFAVRVQLDGGNLTLNGNRIWHAGNDGAGSGLDADTLDGQDGAFYADIPGRLGYAPARRSGDTVTGRFLFAGGVTGNFGIGTAEVALGELEVRSNGPGAAMIAFHRPGFAAVYFGLDTDNELRFGGWSVGNVAFKVWHAGNDGAGSGLDADLLDGQDSAFYTNIPGRLGYVPYNAANPAGYISGITGAMVIGALGYTPWHAGNDGAGSGLDADLLDGRDAASFANASHQHAEGDIAPAFGNHILGASGFQAFPGGLLIQWGQVRGFASSEGVGPAVAFPTPFAAPPFSVTCTPVNNSNSIVRDLAIQTTGRDALGFGTFYQGEGAGGDQTDGFDWIAIGSY